MKFCPNCGKELVEGAKFCPYCGFNIEELTAQSRPSAITEENDSSELEAEKESEETEEEEKLRIAQELAEKYKVQHEYPKSGRICAVDGQKISLLSTKFTLADGYTVCDKHWFKVFAFKPFKNAGSPNLTNFLKRLDDPNHQIETWQDYIGKPSVSTGSTPHVESSSTTSAYHPEPHSSKPHCPKCKSTDIELMSLDANVKTKTSTSLNLNPLHPFTIVNTKEKKKKKHSAGKIAAGVMTGGASLLVTGTHDNKSKQYYCNNCGNVWTQK